MRDTPGDPPIEAGLTGPGEYAPAGEAQGVAEQFTVDQVATAFGVEPERVRRAVAGEFALGDTASLDSSQVQHLAEVLLPDQPLPERQAALMELGAFTPRADHDWGLGEKAPGEESNPPIDPPVNPPIVLS